MQFPWLSSVAPISGAILYQKWRMEQMKPEKQKIFTLYVCKCVVQATKTKSQGLSAESVMYPGVYWAPRQTSMR